MREGAKRLIDVAGALVALALATPVLAVASLAIVLESGLPVLFRQTRSGRNGRPFTIYKLRTMAADTVLVDKPLAEEDPGITRVGRLLRATSIDELPQLLNVLRGEMSLVGPRPTLPMQVEHYDAYQRRRLDVKPGITGWAQVNGRNSLSWDERIDHDVWYVDNRSLLLDLTILLKTVRVAFDAASTWGDPPPSEEVAE